LFLILTYAREWAGVSFGLDIFGRVGG
jgi:hypothetical protein